jgi:hypothetical protein
MFGIGAALPSLLLGLLSRETMASWRNRFMSAGQFAKAGLGILMIAIGALAIGFILADFVAAPTVTASVGADSDIVTTTGTLAIKGTSRTVTVTSTRSRPERKTGAFWPRAETATDRATRAGAIARSTADLRGPPQV